MEKIVVIEKKKNHKKIVFNEKITFIEKNAFIEKLLHIQNVTFQITFDT
jgi:hypothetical protein